MQRAIAYLRSPGAIRERCQQLLSLGCAGKLDHFACDTERLADVAAYVMQVTRAAYPDLDIPFHSRWRHFNAGGRDRLAQLRQQLASVNRDEQARCAIDLVVTSVLLDAGAGAVWGYYEADSDTVYRRSEGLAVASLHMFLDGGFSSRANRPWQADAEGLRQITDEDLARAFQVSSDNPLIGLAGRAVLLRRLGTAVAAAPQYFGTDVPRLGHLYDYFCAQAQGGELPAAEMLRVLLDSLSPIWPERLHLGGVNLGDVWHHPKVAGEGLTAGLVPLHKLSQWLTYSLIEPLQDAGLCVVRVDDLTGLAEYRNGGLFIDLGVLRPKHNAVLAQAHRPETDVVVEWRALTVALLDRVAEEMRQALGLTAQALPLAKVLEGGTWRAGRQIAAARRADAGAPLRVISDGTVF
jgi:hypothetical protein